MGIIHDNPALKDKRRHLRKNLTPAEAALWKVLKSKQVMGRRFRRQHSIGSFIVDFYCAEEKLIIELDGEVHKYQAEYDYERTLKLEAMGFKIIQYENHYVFDSLDAVVIGICNQFKADI